MINDQENASIAVHAVSFRHHDSRDATRRRWLSIAIVVGGLATRAAAGDSPAPDADRFPAELVTFVASPKSPVLTGEKDHWDARIRERGWILREGDIYKLWYTGYDGTREGTRRVGYATSPDGVSWTRHPNNPLIKDEWVEDMMVVKHDGRYLMFAEGRQDRAHLFVSDDGLDWTGVGPLDVRLKSGRPIPEGAYGTPTVWFENDKWHLFYERSDLGVWLAVSTDLKVWTNVQDEPVMSPGPGEYDKDQIALNQIIKQNGRYYAYFHGCAKSGPNKDRWSTSIATSTDLVKWEKYSRNPLLPVSENKSSGIVIHDGENLRLYTMHPEVNLHVPAQTR
jgi:hypothetical protein